MLDGRGINLGDRDLALVGELAKRARELDAEGESITETLSRLAAARGETG